MKNQQSNDKPSAEQVWQARFDELCHEVFLKNDHGRQLLSHMENLYFRSPVALPGQDKSWAYFNEGRNELIRSFTLACHRHMMKSEKDKGQVKRGRK